MQAAKMHCIPMRLIASVFNSLRNASIQLSRSNPVSTPAATSIIRWSSTSRSISAREAEDGRTKVSISTRSRCAVLHWASSQSSVMTSGWKTDIALVEVVVRQCAGKLILDEIPCIDRINEPVPPARDLFGDDVWKPGAGVIQFAPPTMIRRRACLLPSCGNPPMAWKHDSRPRIRPAIPPPRRMPRGSHRSASRLVRLMRPDEIC